jgi:hypothetical protein
MKVYDGWALRDRYRMTPTDEIEPMVPELPRQMLTDGGTRRTRTTRKTFDNSEDDAPLVPDLS